jgi:hypothetical protein
VLSIASSSDIGGMMLPIRFDNIDFPDPGGPTINMLWTIPLRHLNWVKWDRQTVA